MKKIIVVIALFSSICTLAQKEKEEEIVYYTDSDVKHNHFYLGANYSPYYVNRRILSESIGGDAQSNLLNQSTKGDYGYSYGGELYYKFNPNLHISAGVNKSKASYSINIKSVYDDLSGVGDTIKGDWAINTDVEFINVPIQFQLAYGLSDEWDVEIVPMVEMNFGTYMYRDLIVPDGDSYTEITDPDDPYYGDRTEDMRDINWTVGLGLGTNYYITPKLSWYARLHIKYMLRSIIPNDSPSEILLWLGGQTGVRFYL